MKDWLLPVLTIVLGGGIGTLAALLMVPAQIRKLRGDTSLSEADAATKLSAASIAMLEPAQKEMARLNKSLEAAQQKIDTLTGEVSALRVEVHSLRVENARLRSVG